MSTQKIMIPSITLDELKFAAKYVENFPFYLYILISALSWRAQIGFTVKGSIESTQIASLQSMKFIAANLFQRSPAINYIYAAVAVLRSASCDAVEYSTLSDEESRSNFIKTSIENVVTSTGQAEILNLRQISNSDDILRHRRVIMASLRGTHTTTCIYSPNTLFSNISNIKLMNWGDLEYMYFNLLELIGIKVPEPFLFF
jgi:hypothetical protein